MEPMKKLLAVGGAVGLVAVLTAASLPQTHHQIDWGTSSVTFTIPFPGSWQFEVNEPDNHVLVGVDYGSTGTLTIDYPPDYCGLLQADASVGGTHVYGSQHSLGNCIPPTTTTTTTTTTQPPPPTTTTTTPVKPCCVTPGPTTTFPTSAPPQVAPGPAPVVPTTTTVPGQLPNITPGAITAGNG